MERKLMIAGFGGQGIMMMGKMLAYSTFCATDKNVTFFPSYGAEQRGGTANCYVVIADREIGAPLGNTVDDFIAMNRASLEKFAYKAGEGGTLFINSSMVKKKKIRGTTVWVPAAELAMELGSIKVQNMVMLGAYVGYTGVIAKKAVLFAMRRQLVKKSALLPVNEAAFLEGFSIGEAQKRQKVSKKSEGTL